MAQPTELDARSELALGAVILTFALTAQGFVIYNNIPFVFALYGWTALLAYMFAAMAVLGIPVLKAHLPDLPYLRMTEVLFMALTTWVSIEESLHAAEQWKAPPAALHLAQSVLPEHSARTAVLLGFGALVYAVFEMCGRHTTTGSTLLLHGHRKLKRSKRRHKP